MPDEDNNFDDSLVLDYRKSRGHVRPKNRHCYSDFGTIYGKCLIAWLLVEFANNTASDISKLSSKWYLENFELLRAAIIAKYHVQVMLLFADNGSREIFGNAQCKIGDLYLVAVKKQTRAVCISNNIFTSTQWKEKWLTFLLLVNLAQTIEGTQHEKVQSK